MRPLNDSTKLKLKEWFGDYSNERKSNDDIPKLPSLELSSKKKGM